MRKHLLALPALVALLAVSAVGVTAQDTAGPDGLVTEEVEPGVERIIRDDADHDLDAKHPKYRYDMDRIAIAPDGTVWLSSTYSRSDNDAHSDGAMVWALGRRDDTYALVYGAPPPGSGTYLFVDDNGTMTLATIDVVIPDDGGAIADFEAGGYPPAAGGERNVLVARPDGDHTCRNMGKRVRCEDPAGKVATYLANTLINQIAAAPDGTLWAVGGYHGDNGGLYRITLE